MNVARKVANYLKSLQHPDDYEVVYLNEHLGQDLLAIKVPHYFTSQQMGISVAILKAVLTNNYDEFKLLDLQSTIFDYNFVDPINLHPLAKIVSIDELSSLLELKFCLDI